MAPQKAKNNAQPTGAARRSRRVAAKSTDGVAKINKKTNSKAKKATPVRYECTICFRTLASSSFPDELCTEHCKHLINTCRACLKQHISAQLEMKMFDHLSCSECPEIIGRDYVKRYGTKDSYKRFEQLERKAIAERNPGWFWCLNPRCRSGKVHEALLTKQNQASDKITGDDLASSSSMMSTCNDCGVQSCASCERLWHADKTCADVKKQLEEENRASLKTIARECKTCPTCAKPIEKNGGCDAVYCTQCREKFCWLCVTPYTEIISTGLHGDGCIYNASDRLDPHHWPPPGAFQQPVAVPR